MGVFGVFLPVDECAAIGVFGLFLDPKIRECFANKNKREAYILCFVGLRVVAASSSSGSTSAAIGVFEAFLDCIDQEIIRNEQRHEAHLDNLPALVTGV